MVLKVSSESQLRSFQGQNSTFSHMIMSHNNMIANIFIPTPPPDLGDMVNKLQIIGNKVCSNSHSLQPPPHPPLTLGIGSKVWISFFSQHGYVAYKIIGNQVCSNMVANILPTDTPLPPESEDGVNRSNSFFSKHGHVV